MRLFRLLIVCSALLFATGCGGASADASFSHTIEGSYANTAQSFSGAVALLGVNERGQSNAYFQGQLYEIRWLNCQVGVGGCGNKYNFGTLSWGPVSSERHEIKTFSYTPPPPYTDDPRAVFHHVASCTFADGHSCTLIAKEDAFITYDVRPPGCPTPQIPLACEVSGGR